jgi:opacity protein-like surface antigen
VTRNLAAGGLLCLFAVSASAQEPAGPPPPSRNTGREPANPHELLPGIGKIGAEVAVFGGASWNPYEVGQGFDAGGYVNLPLRGAPGGKLSYEIALGMSLATSEPFTVTSSVAYVANLAAGASPAAALAGPPLAPFPVRREVRTQLRLLHLSPFGLKYTITRLDGVRLRPYLAAGLDFVAAITNQDPEHDESLLFTGTAPFDDPLIAGLLAQAPELTARGNPTGQGNFRIGGHVAAGVELRLTRGLSLNLEYRFTGTEGRNGGLRAATGALGFHW